MNNVKSRLGVSALLAVVVLFSFTAAAGATTVTIEPATQSVAAGDSFSISVRVSDVTDMSGNQATVNFDPAAISVSSVTEGDFLKSAGTTIGAGMEQIENENGRATIFYALTTPGKGVSGSGSLATISFTTAAAASGTFTVELSEVLMADSTSHELPLAEIAGGTVSITGTGGYTPTPSSNGGGGGGGDGGSSGTTPTPSPIPSPTTTPTSPLPSPSPAGTPVTPSTSETPAATVSPGAPSSTQTPTPATATPTPRAAGFELLLAIVGVLAVASHLRR